MMLKRIIEIGALALLTGLSGPVSACKDATAPCCKICRDGKACGDSCIAKTDNCTKGKGCACDGFSP